MIQIASDQLITFAQLAKRIPRRRNERPVHPSTIHRWRSPGLRGVRLECIRIGGAWHTSIEAFQRFCERLSEHDRADQQARGQPASAADEQSACYQDRVEQTLKEMGA
jgi:hypothetical protein